MLTKGGSSIKLADFGLAYKFKKGEKKTKGICGTTNYMAPEILKNKGYSYSVDIWAIGVIMFYLKTGEAPFKKDKEKIRTGNFSFKKDFEDEEFANLIKSILVVKESQRLTLDKILES